MVGGVGGGIGRVRQVSHRMCSLHVCFDRGRRGGHEDEKPKRMFCPRHLRSSASTPPSCRTMSGKSVAWKTLMNAKTQMCKDGVEGFHPVGCINFAAILPVVFLRRNSYQVSLCYPTIRCPLPSASGRSTHPHPHGSCFVLGASTCCNRNRAGATAGHQPQVGDAERALRRVRPFDLRVGRRHPVDPLQAVGRVGQTRRKGSNVASGFRQTHRDYRQKIRGKLVESLVRDWASETSVKTTLRCGPEGHQSSASCVRRKRITKY